MIRLLPPWALTNPHPAFLESESGSVLEQTAKMYATVNELVESYNSFSENINKKMQDFFNADTESKQEHMTAIRQEFQDFIDIINLKVMEHNNTLDDAVSFMKTNLSESITQKISELKESGELDEDILTAFENEAKTRADADTLLQKNISNEVINRQNAVGNLQQTLQNSIDSEILARQQADAQLLSKIDNGDKYIHKTVTASPTDNLVTLCNVASGTGSFFIDYSIDGMEGTHSLHYLTYKSNGVDSLNFSSKLITNEDDAYTTGYFNVDEENQNICFDATEFYADTELTNNVFIGITRLS